MKSKSIVIQLLASILTISVNAQQPPNTGFESWVTINTAQNPTGWSSFNNFFSYGVPEMSFKTSEFHLGTSAVKLVSQTAIVPPPLGSNTLDTLAGFVFLGAFDMNNPGIAYTYRPIAIQAYVKGTIVAGGNAMIIATLRKWNSVTKVRDQVALAVYNMTNSIAAYTSVSVPFTYSLPIQPDTLDIKIMAGDVGPGGTIMPGNIFFVDDIALTFPTGINKPNEIKNILRVFPNPINEKVKIQSIENISKVEIYSLLGEPVFLFNLNEPKNTLELNLIELPKGIYFLKVWQGNNLRIEKLVKQ